MVTGYFFSTYFLQLDKSYFLSFFRKDDEEIRNLFSEIEKLREAFESVERPTLDIEVRRAKDPTKYKSESNRPTKDKSG